MHIYLAFLAVDCSIIYAHNECIVEVAATIKQQEVQDEEDHLEHTGGDRGVYGPMGVDGGRAKIARQSRLRNFRQIVHSGGFLEKWPFDGKTRSGVDTFSGESSTARLMGPRQALAKWPCRFKITQRRILSHALD